MKPGRELDALVDLPKWGEADAAPHAICLASIRAVGLDIDLTSEDTGP